MIKPAITCESRYADAFWRNDLDRLEEEEDPSAPDGTPESGEYVDLGACGWVVVSLVVCAVMLWLMAMVDWISGAR